MHAGDTSGPNGASKERLMGNTQSLLHKMNNRNLQTEGEMLPMNMSCSAGGDSLNRKESSADDEDVAEAKYVAAQEEMKGKASSTKYRVPEVIKMSMKGSPSMEKFESKAEMSRRGSKRTFGEVEGGLKKTICEVKGGSVSKKRRVSKSVDGVADFAVPKKSEVKVATTTQSEEGTEEGIKTGKQPLSSDTAGSAKNQPKFETNLSPKGDKVKGVGSSRHAADGKTRKVGRPCSKQYPPTKQILGETPVGDQTW